jgi:4-hydroxybenzoate-CoA ligase/benzoate-CoA ligase
LKLDKSDVAFSAAKLFFAYGLGNGMSFPLHVGCRTVLLADRPTPESVLSVMKDQDVSIFFGVPTLYGAILSDNANDRSKVSEQLRLCVSAGEALPEEIGKEWERRFGVPILDGLGSTELLHIFLSNRPDDVRYGTTGRPVPGYKLRIVDEDDMDVSAGEMGELLVSGPSSAVCYWGQPEKSAQTFQGEWTRSGDKYYKDQQDYYVYCGRTDDMLKVGGIWVSPFEVESALIADERVLEVAVIGYKDDHGLVKPKAYVVLKAGVEKTSELVEELQGFVKDRLAPFKYPRRIDFIDALPKTATGKIQRYKLRHRHTDQP